MFRVKLSLNLLVFQKACISFEIFNELKARRPYMQPGGSLFLINTDQVFIRK